MGWVDRGRGYGKGREQKCMNAVKNQGFVQTCVANWSNYTAMKILAEEQRQ